MPALIHEDGFFNLSYGATESIVLTRTYSYPRPYFSWSLFFLWIESDEKLDLHGPLPRRIPKKEAPPTSTAKKPKILQLLCCRS